MKQNLFTRSFTLLLLGQMFSLIGNYTLKFALSMYVLELTGSAEIFGAVLAVAVVPTILLSPLGGILADRVNRRWLMAGLDALSAVAIFLCICFLQAGGGVAAIAGLQIVLGILGAFESPTVQACVPQLHHGDNLLRANALVNQIQSVAGMATPFAGSLAYTAWGIEAVMRAVSICFLLTAFLECWIHLPAVLQKSGQPPFQILRSDLRQSVHFLRREQPVVLQLLLLAAGINFFASGSITVGLPYLVRTDLGLSAAWYGAAESALGLASVLGGVLVTLVADTFWRRSAAVGGGFRCPRAGRGMLFCAGGGDGSGFPRGQRLFGAGPLCHPAAHTLRIDRQGDGLRDDHRPVRTAAGADAVRMGMGTASGLVRIGDDGGCGTGHSLPLLENLLESCLKNAFK